jgi:hypothetical protein
MEGDIGVSASGRAFGTAMRVTGALLVAAVMLFGVVSHAPAGIDAGTPPGAFAAANTSGSVPPTGTADTSGSVVPSSTPATASVVATTATFARIIGTGVGIHFPAGPKQLVAVGFHQADNRKGKRFVPRMKCLGIKSARTTRAYLKKNPAAKLFQQPRRGRGTSNFSAADCSVPRKTTVLSPVSGIVTNVRSYKLYGRIKDMRLEIRPDGAPHLRVVMIHIDKVKVKKGWRVTGGKSQVAVVRNLKINSTIDRYVPAKRVDHVHIQVNTDKFRGSY